MTDILNTQGNKVGEIDLKDSIFDHPISEVLLTTYVRIYSANQRQGTASTKTRAEVAGSGRKPWKQKGTGRARVGSIRSPIWRHGGIAHGPKPKSWNLSMSKTAKQQAIASALSQKMQAGSIKIIENLNLEKPNTKAIVAFLAALGLNRKSLLILDSQNSNVIKGAANVKSLRTKLVQNISAFDLLNADNIIFVKGAVEKVLEKYKYESK